MARYEHLRLIRLPERMERRKHPGPAGTPARDRGTHSGKLRSELDSTVAAEQSHRRPDFVDPALILRVRMNGMMMEDDWEQLGLTVLATDDDKTLVLFASD